MQTLREQLGDYAYYFKLIPSPDRINWVQTSFAQISPDWPIMQNPLPNIRNLNIIQELLSLCHPNKFMLLLGGNLLDDMYWNDGFVVDLRYDYADAALVSNSSRFNIGEIFFFLEQIGRLGDYTIYDYQLRREINLKLDAKVVEECYNNFLRERMKKLSD